MYFCTDTQTGRRNAYSTLISHKKMLIIGGDKRGKRLQKRVTTWEQCDVTPGNQTPLQSGPQAGITSCHGGEETQDVSNLVKCLVTHK